MLMKTRLWLLCHVHVVRLSGRRMASDDVTATSILYKHIALFFARLF